MKEKKKEQICTLFYRFLNFKNKVPIHKEIFIKRNKTKSNPL